jgi:dipeptidyl aminopeptidase/acylaminoacyl peptidase
VALEPGSEVRGVVDWYGPSNLLAMADGLSTEELAVTRETGWLGVSAHDDPDRARAASPALVDSSAAPPFHIEHGSADAAVPFSQSQEFADALAAHGVSATLVPIDGAGHMWAGVDDTAPMFDRALAFATRVV